MNKEIKVYKKPKISIKKIKTMQLKLSSRQKYSIDSMIEGDLLALPCSRCSYSYCH